MKTFLKTILFTVIVLMPFMMTSCESDKQEWYLEIIENKDSVAPDLLDTGNLVKTLFFKQRKSPQKPYCVKACDVFHSLPTSKLFTLQKDITCYSVGSNDLPMIIICCYRKDETVISNLQHSLKRKIL